MSKQHNRPAGGFRFEVGRRVRLTNDIDRYPHFIAPKGATGTVTEAHPDLYSVKLDELLPGAEEWDNEVCWYPTNSDSDNPNADLIATDEPWPKRYLDFRFD